MRTVSRRHFQIRTLVIITNADAYTASVKYRKQHPHTHKHTHTHTHTHTSAHTHARTQALHRHFSFFCVLYDQARIPHAVCQGNRAGVCAESETAGETDWSQGGGKLTCEGDVSVCNGQLHFHHVKEGRFGECVNCWGTMLTFNLENNPLY